jgi:hypothetical protein
MSVNILDSDAWDERLSKTRKSLKEISRRLEHILNSLNNHHGGSSATGDAGALLNSLNNNHGGSSATGDAGALADPSESSAAGDKEYVINPPNVHGITDKSVCKRSTRLAALPQVFYGDMEYVALNGGKLIPLNVGDMNKKTTTETVYIDGEECLGLKANAVIRKGEEILDIRDGFAVRYHGKVPLELRPKWYRRQCLHDTAAANGYDLSKVPPFKSYIFREHVEKDVPCVYVMCSSKYVAANTANCRASKRHKGNVEFHWVGEMDGYFALCALKRIKKNEAIILNSYDKSSHCYDQEKYAFMSL